MIRQPAADKSARAPKTAPGAVRFPRRLAWLLDECIPLPGGYRIGIDGLIGLVPGAGDAAGAAISMAIVAAAGRRGVPTAVLLRMMANIFIELVIGAIPLVGDLFDFAWKANSRNLGLMERAAVPGTAIGPRSLGWLIALLFVGVALVAGALWLLVSLLRWLIAALGIY